MRLRREPNNRSNPTNLPSLSASQRKRPVKQILKRRSFWMGIVIHSEKSKRARHVYVGWWGKSNARPTSGAQGGRKLSCLNADSTHSVFSNQDPHLTESRTAASLVRVRGSLTRSIPPRGQEIRHEVSRTEFDTRNQFGSPCISMRNRRRLSKRSATGHDHGDVQGITNLLHLLVVDLSSTRCHQSCIGR